MCYMKLLSNGQTYLLLNSTLFTRLLLSWYQYYSITSVHIQLHALLLLEPKSKLSTLNCYAFTRVSIIYTNNLIICNNYCIVIIITL